MKTKKNKLLILLTVAGVVLFAVVATIVIKSTQTVTAIVPAQDLSAGTTITASMLKQIEVPVNTPKGYITDYRSIQNQKLKVPVKTEQLLYTSDVISSYGELSTGKGIPKDYVVTSIDIPSNRAVGGMITAGSTVDILGIPSSEFKTASPQTMSNYIGGVAQSYYGAQGVNLYWVLTNVKILETNATQATDNDQKSTAPSTYIVALSYDDYKKLRLCEQYLDLWMSIAPTWNTTMNKPMDDIMSHHEILGMMDSQKQSVVKETKNGKLEITDVKNADANKESEESSNTSSK